MSEPKRRPIDPEVVDRICDVAISFVTDYQRMRPFLQRSASALRTRAEDSHISIAECDLLREIEASLPQDQESGG